MIGNGLIVKFHNRVQDGLGHEVMQAEASGILLGRRTADEVTVEDFEPVNEECGIQESVDWFRSLPQGLDVLGFYRTQTPPDFSWNELDEQTMRRFFDESGSLLLLLKPEGRRWVSSEVSVLMDVFILEDGVLRPAADPAPFPRDEIALLPKPGPPPTVEAAELPSPPVPSPLRSPLLAPATPPLPRRSSLETRPSEPHSPLPAATRPRRVETDEGPDRSWLWVAALLILTVAGAVLGYRSVDSSSNQSQPLKEQPVKEQPAPAPAATAHPAAAVSQPPAPEVPKPSPLADEALVPVIQAAILRWQRAVLSGDPDRLAACYAPQLERYFSQRNASSAEVRRVAMQSVARYGRPAILRVSGVSIIPISPDRALATFRRHWQTGAPKVFAGEDQERMAFVRVRDEWKIASEEQIKVYWTRKPR